MNDTATEYVRPKTTNRYVLGIDMSLEPNAPLYDDTRYFSRGRPAYRPDPKTRERVDFWWALVAVGIVVALFFVVRAIMPVVH